MTLAPIDQAARDRFHLSADQKGVVITDVSEGGAAAQRGVKPGDVILEMQQGGEVSTPEDVRRRVETVRREDRKSVLMLIQRSDGMNWVPLPLDGGKAPG
jgi:serine protease Do